MPCPTSAGAIPRSDPGRVRARAPRPRSLALVAVPPVLAVFAVFAAHADPISPLVHAWVPKHADSLTVQSERARVGFRAAKSDSAGGDHFLPYQQVGLMVRNLLVDMGREHMPEAGVLEGVLKAQGLVADLRVDPGQPGFAMAMVRNPYRPSADAVAFLYWYRGSELKYQGQYVPGGRDSHFRVWWSGGQWPYTCAFTFHQNDARRTLGFIMLRLESDVSSWTLTQFPGNGPDIGWSGEADFHDVNGDGVTELVAWLRVPSDTAFTECTGCPGVNIERVYTLHERGYDLEDSRVVPTPYATFQRLISELADHNRPAALRLLLRPTLLDSALAEGWGANHGPGSWRLVRVEAGEQWPRWLDMRHESQPGRPEYAVHFAQHDGHWVISHWFREPTASSALPADPKGPGASAPAPGNDVKSRSHGRGERGGSKP